MNIPCLKAESRCFPCAGDSSNPFANLSIEPFDLNLFSCVYFGSVVNVVPNVWQRSGCVGFDESPTSQTDACDRATRRALECVPEPPDPPRPPPEGPPPNPPSPSSNFTFCNDEVTCQSGSSCYTLPECTVLGNSKAEANAIAQSLCNNRVLDPELSQPCSSIPPSPPLPPPQLPCPSELGAAAPDSLETVMEVEWIASQTISVPPWTVDGGDVRFNTFDLPPGEYKIHNLDGYADVPTGGVCPVGNATRIIYPGLNDDESTILSPVQCALGPFCPAPSEEDNMRANCEADVNFLPGGTRLNGTGRCFLIVGSGPGVGGGGYTVPEEHVVSLVQPIGLIPQPRKLQIVDYGTLSFADPVGAGGWDGAFNTRAAYEAADLRWEAPANVLFDGAVVRYTMAHPTSANSKGWQLDIFSAGMILMWRGFKAVGNTSIGRYYKDSTSTPVGPNCVTCADASDDVWYPGASPP
jgi:hypothetical protein